MYLDYKMKTKFYLVLNTLSKIPINILQYLHVPFVIISSSCLHHIIEINNFNFTFIFQANHTFYISYIICII